MGSDADVIEAESSPRQAEGLEPARLASLEPPLMVIEPTRGWQLVNLGELWRYRDLLLILTWRDIKVRYKQTVLGALWAIIQPLAGTAIFSVFLALLSHLIYGTSATRFHPFLLMSVRAAEAATGAARRSGP